MPFYYYFDPTYILIIIGIVISLIAQAGVNSSFRKYSQVKSRRQITGAQAADIILRNAGIRDVTINHIRGDLTDNYSPRDLTLNLSDSVFNNSSVAAIGVAAHECGHAIQDAEGYVPIRIRNAIVPVANIGATISWPLIIIGIIAGWYQPLITAGILLFSAVVLFHLVTLPVEINASRRALRILSDSGMLYEEEVTGASKVLKAAAMTYVAALASSALQLLRLILLTRNRD